jgi:hypothetical protein
MRANLPNRKFSNRLSMRLLEEARSLPVAQEDFGRYPAVAFVRRPACC